MSRHLQILSAAVNPVAGILSVLVSALSRRPMSAFAFTLSVFLIFSFLPVLWDVKNNYLQIALYSWEGLNAYTLFISALMDLGLNYFTVVACLAFLTIYLTASAMIEHLNKRGDLKNFAFFLMLALFLSNFNYQNIVGLQKTALAVALFVCALNFSVTLKPIFMGLAVVVHPILFVAVVAYYVTFSSIITRLLLNRFFVVSVLAIFLFFATFFIDYVQIAASYFGDRAQFYFNREKSNYSTEFAQNTVRILRQVALVTMAGGLVAVAQLQALPMQRLIAICVSLCMIGLILSWQETYLERFVIMSLACSTYTVVQLKISTWSIAFITLPSFGNFALHAVYTTLVIFSPDYVISGDTAAQRQEAATKLVYLPTPLLLIDEEMTKNQLLY